MQSPHLKYFQGKNQDLYLFFHETGTLYYKALTLGGWSHTQILAEKTGPMFSIAYYENQVFVLYSSIDGMLMLAKTTDFNHWERRQLLPEKRDLSRTKFFMSPDQNAFHLIYHLPTENTGIHSLIYASFQNGEWTNSYQIDRFMPFVGESFLTGQVSRNHVIVYYRTARNVISAREMLFSPYTIGSVNPIIQTPYPCVDISIINDSQRIHLLYIVKGMFRSQVVYQYKQSASISTPRVIWEDVSCENCMVFQEKGQLKLMWISGGQPYLCVSENNGGNFLAVEKYTASFPKHVVKGQFIQANPEGAPIQAAEALGDSREGYAMAVFGAGQNVTTQPVMINAASSSNTFENSMLQQTASQEDNVYLEQQEQIEELTRLLSQRSEEITEVNARWKEQTQALEQEIIALQRSLYMQQQENQQLKQTLEGLEQRLSAAVTGQQDLPEEEREEGIEESNE